MPPRKCLEKHCPVRVEGGSYCPEHAALRGGEGPGGYKPLYGSAAWQRARRQARQRDGERCVVCGSTVGLQVHHVNGNPADLRLENLVTLCGEHHGQAHALR